MLGSLMPTKAHINGDLYSRRQHYDRPSRPRGFNEFPHKGASKVPDQDHSGIAASLSLYRGGSSSFLFTSSAFN